MSLLLLLGFLVQEPKLDEAFRVLADAVAKDEVPGVSVLIAKNGRILREESYGLCDIEEKRAFEKTTLCCLASITKPVTAAALMTLVDEGKLALDDPAEKYLPEFLEQKDKDGKHHSFTIRHLLTHSSGLPANPPNRKSSMGKDWLSQKIEDIVKATAGVPLEFAPGSKASYSNAGFFVLARVIEVVSGTPYADFVKARILDPLGMKDSYYRVPAEHAKRVATCYSEKSGKRTRYFRFDPKLEIVNTSPSGGLFSHPADLLRFMQLFLDDQPRVLSKASVQEMLKTQRPGRGLSWALKDGVFSHGGSTGTYAWGDPKTGIVGIVFFQCNGDASIKVRARFLEALQR